MFQKDCVRHSRIEHPVTLRIIYTRTQLNFRKPWHGYHAYCLGELTNIKSGKLWEISRGGVVTDLEAELPTFMLGIF